VRVEGARRLRATLRKAGADLDDMKDAHAAVAAMVAAAARAATPRRTGRLAATVRGNRALSRATILAGYASVPYAGPIHWGWPRRNITAQPWLADTAALLEPRWTAVYADGVDRAIANVKGA